MLDNGSVDAIGNLLDVDLLDVDLGVLEVVQLVKLVKAESEAAEAVDVHAQVAQVEVGEIPLLDWWEGLRSWISWDGLWMPDSQQIGVADWRGS